MEFTIKSGEAHRQRTACVVVGIHEARRLSEAAQHIDSASKGYITELLKRGDINGKVGQTLLLHNIPQTLAERVLLVGCGRERELHDAQFLKIVTTATKALADICVTDAFSYLAELHVTGRDLSWRVRQLVEATRDTLYRFDQLKSKKDVPRRALRKFTLGIADRKAAASAHAAMQAGVAIANGVELAKNLGNLPGNICTPSYLAEQAVALGKEFKSIKVTVLEERDMQKLGMGSLLSVSRGSREDAKLILMEYKNAPKTVKPIALVGKGLTFDAGGISIKPAADMDLMKYDMCGGASVFGALRAAAELKLPLNIIGAVPASENLPDGAANKPGDIVTSMSGQTIEILNTDAEGRLILCDTLTYIERYEPSAVIDIATLTGACVVALGRHASGLFGNHHPLIHDLLNAGKYAYDRAWELPLWDDYQDQLKSNFADMANVGGRDGGAITAACFLARYTKKLNWAHLDIAGTAWRTGSDKGATGRPVPLLTQYLLDQCASQAPA
ncbi:MAG: leucyl aminopeptidase [Gammaproteobacteria bacterium]|nr:leucyl aminopeptidase [Gammaproteobacteria bacterium]